MAPFRGLPHTTSSTGGADWFLSIILLNASIQPRAFRYFMAMSFEFDKFSTRNNYLALVTIILLCHLLIPDT